MNQKRPNEKTTLVNEIEQLRFALDNVSAYVYMKDRESRYFYANKLTLELFGCTAEELIGRGDHYFFPADVTKHLREIDLRVFAGESTQEEVVVGEPGDEQRIYLEVKTPIYDKLDDGQIIGLLGISTDITTRKKMEEEVRQLAFTDSLTKLPNRRLLFERLEQAQRRSKRQNSYAAVLFVDLNKFKLVNDTHGHDIGDQLLTEVAIRLRQQVRDTDTVARIGGDEFIVLLEGAGSKEKQAEIFVDEVAERIEKVLQEEYIFGELKLRISASIGIHLFFGDAMTASQILRNADKNMYQKKRNIIT